MAKVKVEDRDGVSLVRMQNGVTNPLSPEFVEELRAAIEGLARDPSLKGVVLTGSEKFFSIGFDLPQLIKLDRDGMKGFLHSVNRLCGALASFPRPTVAAVTGHATAGGCIVAMCCENRIIAEGRKLMGLNEIKLGLTVPHLAVVILTDLVGPRIANEVMMTGDFYSPEKALSMGLVDEVHPVGEVVTQTIKRAGRLEPAFFRAYEIMRSATWALVESKAMPQMKEQEDAFLDLWFSESTRPLLKEASKKF